MDSAAAGPAVRATAGGGRRLPPAVGKLDGGTIVKQAARNTAPTAAPPGLSGPVGIELPPWNGVGYAFEARLQLGFPIASGLKGPRENPPGNGKAEWPFPGELFNIGPNLDRS